MKLCIKYLQFDVATIIQELLTDMFLLSSYKNMIKIFMMRDVTFVGHPLLLVTHLHKCLTSLPISA